MVKLALLGLSATTSLVLVGAGGVLTGVLALKGVQWAVNKKADEKLNKETAPAR